MLAPRPSSDFTVVPSGFHPEEWEPNCSQASCPARAVQRPVSPDPFRALSVGQREAVFTFSHHWRWLGGRQLALVSAPGSWRLGFHSSSRWFCLKTPERGREGCTGLVSSPQL